MAKYNRNVETHTQNSIKETKVNSDLYSLCAYSTDCLPKSSKTSVSGSNRHSAAKLGKKFVQQRLKDDLAIFERELELSKRNVRANWVALSAFKTQAQYESSSNEESTSCDDSMWQYLSKGCSVQRRKVA